MAESKEILLRVILECFGCVILGAAQCCLRDITVRYYGLIFFPFMVWAAYVTCYRATGGHLNPIISLVSLLR